MKSLLLKDMLNLRKYFRTLALFIILYSFISFSMDDLNLLSGMITMFFAMIPITSFSYDQHSNWDLFALSLPISRKDIVFSKYLLSIGFIGTGAILSLLIGYIITMFKDSATFDVKTQLIVAYSLFAIGIVFISVLLPLIYKFGIEKSRIMMLVVFLVPTLIIILLAKSGIPMPTDADLLILLKISPILIGMILFVSFYISYKLFMGKDL
ncbi:ABC-2 transporter permease [Bacillus massiliigorillae]|uniref:ABC-2 transporter permease n=1 Tax=Bacillus massiliigorillae TaxID=1243664 RepID=UPI0003A8D19E|nr:ABC-2 transporter permease [Bacillus massiliigorillae]